MVFLQFSCGGPGEDGLSHVYICMCTGGYQVLVHLHGSEDAPGGDKPLSVRDHNTAHIDGHMYRISASTMCASERYRC